MFITGEPLKAAAQRLFQVGTTLDAFYTVLFYLIFLKTFFAFTLKSKEMEMVERAGWEDADGPRDIKERNSQDWGH